MSYFIIQIIPRHDASFVAQLNDLIKQKNLPIKNVTMPKVKVEGQEKLLCSGYIVIECDELTPDLQVEIRSISLFRGFLLHDMIPAALKEHQVHQLLSLREQNVKKTFEIGQTVKIKHGSFQSMCGTIEQINYEKNRLIVEIPVFSRLTKIDLDFSHVEHV